MDRARSKIVCTLGPSSSDPAVIERMALAGMDVARVNFSHGTHADHARAIEVVRSVGARLGRPIAVLQDLCGPKIRIGTFREGKVKLVDGQAFTVTSREVEGDETIVSCAYAGLPDDVQAGDRLMLADGMLELRVESTNGIDIRCTVVAGGVLSARKGISLTTRSVKLQALTSKDFEDLAFGLEQGVDYVALSFVRGPEDVIQARAFCEERGQLVPLIAKIEKHEAVQNVDAILEEADGIMIARGDLGVETRLEAVPLIQKRLIAKASQVGKPVITATQMLVSMVSHPRPTRAEVTDVANAVLDGTDALMLSEETAAGDHPVEAVAFMNRIARDAEQGFPHEAWIEAHRARAGRGIPEAVSHAAYDLAESIGAAAIITFTDSGSTARAVARYRPRRPVLAPTPNLRTWRQLALVWGVTPMLTATMASTDEMIERACNAAREAGLVTAGDTVVMTAGIPVGKPGTTNMIKAERLT